jgi:hypothetical protein
MMSWYCIKLSKLKRKSEDPYLYRTQEPRTKSEYTVDECFQIIMSD